MALGEAIAALLHSSDRWKGASYPLIVQIIAMKDIRTAIPSGHSVPFWMAQTCDEGKNLGPPSIPVTEAGIIIITMNKAIMFSVDPYELNLAIQRVGMLEMQP